MAAKGVYIGQRRSYGGALCTVRYQGLLPGLKGEWLGVEWDDPTRGKHDGQHERIRLFECLSSSPTAASFIRSSRTPDPERTVLEAIKFKYAPKPPPSDKGAKPDAIAISGKVVEEVGFDRIQAQLSVLADLKIVLVDELVVSGVARHGASRDETRAAQEELARSCPNIVELDIGWNVVETWADVGDICAPLKKLRILKASGLRLRAFKAQAGDGAAENAFRNIEELHLGECLLSPEQIIQTLSPPSGAGGGSAFPNLKTLVLSSNNLHFFTKGRGTEARLPSVTTVMLDNNKFKDLSSLPNLVAMCPNMSSLSLQGNFVSEFNLEGLRGSDTIRFEGLETLNLARNKVRGYDFIDALPGLFPNLTSLRISRNPLYESVLHGEGQDQDLEQRQHSRTVDSTNYYLTLARVPGLKSLNYTTITDRDREEGEIYYLSVAEKEIVPLLLETGGDENTQQIGAEDVEQRARKARRAYPLYTSLCAKYDREDVIARFVEERGQAAERRDRDGGALAPVSELDSYAPGTLGSRLVDAHFYIPLSYSVSEGVESNRAPEQTALQRLLPTTVSVYRLKALIAKQFGLPALQFRLVYESHEYDPVEPISRTTRQDGLAGKNWDGWGDWDVDDAHQNGGEEYGGHDEREADVDGEDSSLAFIVRQGQRFRKRETEILDGMRAWGDFLDLTAADGSRRKDVRVRVEPQIR